MSEVNLAQVTADLHWLAGRGALAGVAGIIAERRRQLERGDPPPGQYAAEKELDFGNYVEAGALIAAGLDLEAGTVPQPG